MNTSCTCLAFSLYHNVVQSAKAVFTGSGCDTVDNGSHSAFRAHKFSEPVRLLSVSVRACSVSTMLQNLCTQNCADVPCVHVTQVSRHLDIDQKAPRRYFRKEDQQVLRVTQESGNIKMLFRGWHIGLSVCTLPHFVCLGFLCVIWFPTTCRLKLKNCPEV